MTESELREEIQNCGLDHLGATRVDAIALREGKKLWNLDNWYFRLTEQSGTVPLTVTRRGPVKFVKADGLEIEPWDQDELDVDYDLTDTGTADYWYIDVDDKLTTYPVTTDTVTVRHFIRTPSTITDILTDIPAEYHDIIAAGAVAFGKLENGELEAYAAWKATWTERVAEMKRDLFNVEVTGPRQLNAQHEGS